MALNLTLSAARYQYGGGAIVKEWLAESSPGKLSFSSTIPGGGGGVGGGIVKEWLAESSPEKLAFSSTIPVGGRGLLLKSG